MTTQSGTPGSYQVLTFVLGRETYGVDILRVQEIRGWSSVTKIPHTPPHVLGVLNLRGSIVPIGLPLLNTVKCAIVDARCASGTVSAPTNFTV